MKFIKNLVSSLIVLFIILTLFSCGVNKNNHFTKLFKVNNNNFVDEEEAVEEVFAYETAAAPMAMKSMATFDAAPAYGIENGSINTSSNDERKLIKYVSIQSETKNFDETIDWLKKEVDNFKGIVDNFYLDLGNKTNNNFRKSGNFSIRVPFDRLEDFIKKINEKVNVTYHNENIEDVTDNYNESHSRLLSLRIEEKKLNDLMSKATNIADVIALEEKLSEVRSQIQRLESKIKNYDKKIVYSTININILEVRDLTEAIEKEDYSTENIMKQLTKNFEATKKFLINTGVYIFTHIPAILLTILIIVIVVLILSFIVRFIFGNHIKKDVKVVLKEKKDEMKDEKIDKDENNKDSGNTNVIIEEIK